MSIFANVDMAPGDPILGLTETYRADPRTEKVNLGVGIYVDDAGRIPVLEAVRRVEEALVRKGEPRMLAAVNETLTELEKSGKATQIFDHWFGKDSDLKMKRTFTFAPYKQP